MKKIADFMHDSRVNIRFFTVFLLGASLLTSLGVAEIPQNGASDAEGDVEIVTELKEESAKEEPAKAAPKKAAANQLNLLLRSQKLAKPSKKTVADQSQLFSTVLEKKQWKPEETAIHICDMWDAHHSPNASRRVAELAPRINQFAEKARSLGVVIVHCPSSTLKFYAQHPARQRTVALPAAPNMPKTAHRICHWLDAHEEKVYPIDQMDGGITDDTLAERAKWAAKIKHRPFWQRQIATIQIDAKKDYMTDKGKDIWNIHQKHGIKNVILVGVHTNMCVLHRPFGLRQMRRHGRQVVLARDLTDLMYSAKKWPFVNHFTGGDFIIRHIERWVAPTIISGQIIGDGVEFRFKGDHRKHLVILAENDHYNTAQSFPNFALQHLGHDFRTTFLVENGESSGKGLFTGFVEALKTADVVLVSVRRVNLPTAHLAALKKFIQSGKPVVGIRTASHPFHGRRGKPPAGRAWWPEFDADILGGSYAGHHKGTVKTYIRGLKEAAKHPIMAGVDAAEITSGGTLYKVLPLGKKTNVLMMGRAGDLKPHEPIAWTNTNIYGGRVFYTSLGHYQDFKLPQFQRLLKNGICWAVNMKPTVVTVEKSLKRPDRVKKQQFRDAPKKKKEQKPTSLRKTTAAKEPAVKKDAVKKQRPNIVFIFTDDHAYQSISAYGSKINKTPNIDRIAKEGMRFDRCYVTNSICGPMRAVIQTGKYSHLNGNHRNHMKFNNDQQTFPKLLQKAGYATALLGKWHLVCQPKGFDYYHILTSSGGQGSYYNPKMNTSNGPKSHTGYTTDIITDLTLEWLKKGRDKNKPFMVMCQHKAPHRNWMPGPKYLTKYDNVTIPEPATLFDDYKNRPSALSKQDMTISQTLHSFDLKLLPRKKEQLTPAQQAAWDKAYKPKNDAFKKANLQGKALIRWKYQRYIKDYLRCIDSVDENVGRVLDYLDKNGLSKNTIVIYASDQGFYLGDHGWFDKRWMYEESFRTPFIAKWPGNIKPGSVNNDIVSPLDFAQTFLDIAGEKQPADMQGASLIPVFKGKTPNDWRKSFYYHYYEFPGVHSVRRHYGVADGRYKLIHYYPATGQAKSEWHLVDLKVDPHEMKNFYDDAKYAKTRAKLHKELDRLRKLHKVPADDLDKKKRPPKVAKISCRSIRLIK